MTQLTLYYTPGTCAQAVRIALEEADAACRLGFKEGCRVRQAMEKKS